MKTKTFVLVSLLGFSTLALTPLVSAATLELLKPESADLAATSLVQGQAPEMIATPTSEPVRVAWALDPKSELAERPNAPVSQSQSYWFYITAGELEAGVSIDTTAASAVVRVNPLDGHQISLDPQTFKIIVNGRMALTGDEAMEYLVSSEQLAASDNPFPEGTAAFRLRAELGAGRFVLSAPLSGTHRSHRFVVHVHEPDSDVIARLAMTTGATLAGQPIQAAATLDSTGIKTRFTSAKAFLIAPNGQRSALNIDGNLMTTAVIDTAFAGGELWEIEFRMTGRTKYGQVRRTVRTAFAVAAATAGLDGRAEVISNGSLSVRIGVDSAARGRYEIRGILWGTNADGLSVPIAVGHSAASFGIGRKALELVFDEKLLATSGTSAPYELRDLQLTDQTRMGVLHRQARALMFD